MIIIIFICACLFSAGSLGVKVKSAVRSMGWKIETCGVRPAAGKKPARGLWTELPWNGGVTFHACVVSLLLHRLHHNLSLSGMNPGPELFKHSHSNQGTCLFWIKLYVLSFENFVKHLSYLFLKLLYVVEEPIKSYRVQSLPERFSKESQRGV